MDLNKLPLAPAYGIHHPNTPRWDDGCLPVAIRLPMAAGCLHSHPPVPGWTFLGKVNFELTSLGVLSKGMGPYLDVVKPADLPELKLEFEARGCESRGEQSFQRYRIMWSSHKGVVSRKLTHELCERVDDLFDYTKALNLFAETRIFGDGTCHDFSGAPGPWGSSVANYYYALPRSDRVISHPGIAREAFLERAERLECALGKVDPFSYRTISDASGRIQAMKEQLGCWRKIAGMTPAAAV